MPPTRVIILSGRSLFADGVASRLRQRTHALELDVVDPRRPETMARLITAQPSAIILDATDSEVTGLYPLSRLLAAIPSLKLIRLDPQREEVQVVTSQQRTARQVGDLIEVIEGFNQL